VEHQSRECSLVECWLTVRPAGDETETESESESPDQGKVGERRAQS